MDAALEYDYQAPLDYALVDITAEALMIGDTIVSHGHIPLRVTDVRTRVSGFIVAAYESLPGTGHRLYSVTTPLTVLRQNAEQAH